MSQSTTRKAYLSIALGAALAACTASPQDDASRADGKETVDGETYRFEGVASFDRLSKAELVAFTADRRYLQSLVSPDTAIRLNMADDRQHRFAMARMKLAGKTAENAPQLFESIASLRKSHLAAGYGRGLHPQAFARTKSDGITAMHFIGSSNLYSATELQASSTTTFPGGTFYTYSDTGVFDDEGTPIANMGWAEEYAGGTDVTVYTTADPTLTSKDELIIDSYRIEDSVDGFNDSYTYRAQGRPPIGPFTTADPVIEAPIDTRNNDDLISICLNRTWTQDCDYDLTGTPQAVKVPLAGSVSITSAGYTFDTAAIAALANGTVTDQYGNPDPGGYIRVVLANAGGGCDVGSGGVLNTKMQLFWQTVTVDGAGTTLSWDMTDANAALFDDSCRQVQDDVKLTMNFKLPWLRGVVPGRSFLTLTNEFEQEPSHSFDRIEMTNSCLAAGTQVQLADGTSAAIESLAQGQQVFNPHRAGQRSLTVQDTARGFETAPMVRIADDAGRTLLLTELHPVVTEHRGIVLARDLAEGDVVKTATGPSRLVTVSRESYDGQVYNLKLGSSDEMSALGEDQTVLYANGFLVGDGQIQKKYEAASRERKSGPVVEQLPAQWHADYRHSARR